MKPATLPLALAAALTATGAAAQVENMGSKAATFISAEDVKTVNALPGVDRQIVSVDIGKLNEAVGIVHRGTTRRAPGAAPAAPAAATAAGQPACGVAMAAPPADVAGTGIAHIHQTETYVIVGGGGDLITGGQIINGRASAPDSAVTTILNGPSCSGRIGGPGVVKRTVKTGDIIVIPAGVPHGWSDIPDFVDYLSIRPDPDRVLKPYVNPAVQKK